MGNAARLGEDVSLQRLEREGWEREGEQQNNRETERERTLPVSAPTSCACALLDIVTALQQLRRHSSLQIRRSILIKKLMQRQSHVPGKQRAVQAAKPIDPPEASGETERDSCSWAL